jgi:hypothetical protein
MPVLAAAQKQETGVRFVFVNQGENGTTAQRYLTAAGLDIANVLLDPRRRHWPRGRFDGFANHAFLRRQRAAGRYPPGRAIDRLAGE